MSIRRLIKLITTSWSIIRTSPRRSTVGGKKFRYFEEPAVAVKIKKEKTDEKETSSKYFKPTRSTSKKIDQVDKQRRSLERPNNAIGVEDVSVSKKDEQNLSVNRRSSRTSTKLNEIDEGRRNNNNNNNRKSYGDKVKEPVINKSRYFKTSSQKDSAEFGNEKLEKNQTNISKTSIEQKQVRKNGVPKFQSSTKR